MRTRRTLRHLLWLIPFAFFLACFIWLLQLRLPQIGGDYPMFIRYLLEGRWHVAHYGIAPLRYAVHLCGGMPMYGHPNELSYSLLQALALWMDPWNAVQVILVLTLAAGYAGWYRLGRDVLKVGVPWSHVLALVVQAHGFYLMHVIEGHMNFFQMPLIGWMLWLLLSPASRHMTLALRTALFALLSASILHAGGYFTLLFFAMMTPALLPVLYVCRPTVSIPSLRELLLRSVALGGGALILSCSKLVAVGSLMQAFPRTVPFGHFPSGINTFLAVLRSLWALPQDTSFYTNMPWGSVENSMFLSPVVLVGTMLALFFLLQPAKKGALWRQAFLIVYCAILLEICLELAQGFGPSMLLLERFPLFTAIRVMTRFLYPFSLLLTMAAVAALHRFFAHSPRYDRQAAATALAVTALCFPLAHLRIVEKLHLPASLENMRITIHRMERSDFTQMPVAEVMKGNTDFQGKTGLVCLGDALFSWADQPQSRILQVGPTTTVRDGYFNLMNPACYAYPEANNCTPGDRIASDDRENFEAFRTGQPLTWKMSRTQWLADGLSLLGFLLLSGTAVWHAVSAWIPKVHRRRKAGTAKPRRRSRS